MSKLGADKQLYVARAYAYDLAVAALAPARRRAVEALELRDGATVLDVACGTGLNIPALRAGVGPTGLVLAFDASEQMLAQARARVEAAGWQNVILTLADAAEVRIPVKPEAALFSFTHDVIVSERAVARTVSQLAQDAIVVSTGARLPGRFSPLNPFIRIGLRAFADDRTSLSLPWRCLRRYAELEISASRMGPLYRARGRLRPGAIELAAALSEQQKNSYGP